MAFFAQKTEEIVLEKGEQIFPGYCVKSYSTQNSKIRIQNWFKGSESKYFSVYHHLGSSNFVISKQYWPSEVGQVYAHDTSGR